MSNIVKRLLNLDLPAKKSAFLWGPRLSGKSYWIRQCLPDVLLIDLLKSDVFVEYALRPALLRERYSNMRGRIVIDEIQKLPALLDEVHWMIENTGASFLLTGSSARKLRRGHANLLGGRAWQRRMTPLTSREVDDFAPEKVILSGLLPPHYLAANPVEELRAYMANYLRDEISAEGAVRNLPAFGDFLRVAALTNGELLNVANIARECGVSVTAVRSYFEILEDTFLGYRLQPWRRAGKRRLIGAEKFYLFDAGVSNYLARRQPQPGTPEFGKSFEQLLFMELMAYRVYRAPEMEICYWRTSAGQEVDFIVDDKKLAIEVKASARVHDGDTAGLRALQEDGPVGKIILVCREPEPRRLGNIEIMPLLNFLDGLWAGEWC